MLMISPPFFLPHQPPKLKEGVREVTQFILAQWTRVTCWWLTSLLFSSVAQLCPTLWPHGLQHARLPCPSPTLGACSNSCPWKSVMPSNHLILCRPLLLLPSVFPSIGSFPMSQFFTSGGQSTGVSASTSVLPMNTQDWFPLGWTGWISLQSRELSKSLLQHLFFSNTTSNNTPFCTCCWFTWCLWVSHSPFPDLSFLICMQKGLTRCLLWLLGSMEIMNNHIYDKNRGEFYSTQTGDNSSEDIFSNCSEQIPQGNVVFRTVLYFVRTKHQAWWGYISSRFQKRLAHTQWVRMTSASGKGEPIMSCHCSKC